MKSLAQAGNVNICIQDPATGLFYNVTSDHPLPVTHSHASGMDFYTAVNLGVVPGCRRVSALGNNPDVDSGSVPEDITYMGGLYTNSDVAQTYEVTSSSGLDTVSGAGARTIVVFGLDLDYVEQSETVEMNGTVAVPLTKNYLRINSALITSAGSNEVNSGNILIRVTGGGTVRAMIPAACGITRQARYTVPAGHTLFIRELFCCINRSGGGAVRYATIGTCVRSDTRFHRMSFEFSVSSNEPYRHPAEIVLPEKTDFSLRCVNVTSDNTDITAAWIGCLINNALLTPI